VRTPSSPYPPHIGALLLGNASFSDHSDALRARAKPLKEANAGPVQESAGRFSPYSLDGVLDGDKDERREAASSPEA
jgi:hypothetical protein